MFNRRVDDASGNTAIHLVNGIWGELSIGFFADPNGGLKGLFIDGSTYQLVIQIISSMSLMVWSATATLFVLMAINCVIPIRMSAEDELKGGDLSELFLGTTSAVVARKSLTTLDRIISIATPIARRFSGAGTADDKNFEHFGRNKMFGHTNEAFDRRESLKY